MGATWPATPAPPSSSSPARAATTRWTAGASTLAGTAVAPRGRALEEARDAYRAAVRDAAAFIDFGDFTTYVLEVDRVRWVGGLGRMESIEPAAYRAADG